MRALSAALVITATVLAGCAGVVGNGKVESESRDLQGFTAISMSGSGSLRVHRGPFKVELRADSNILPLMTTEIVGTELRIGLKPGTAIVRATRLEYDVSLPGLEGVALSGSGDADIDPANGARFKGSLSGSGRIKATLDFQDLELIASGSGAMDMASNCSSMDLRLSGSGEVRLTGSAQKGQVKFSGSGFLDGRSFSFGDLTVRASGSGRVEARVKGHLDAGVSGSTGLRYWGNPSVTSKASGSAKVRKAGD